VCVHQAEEDKQRLDMLASSADEVDALRADNTRLALQLDALDRRDTLAALSAENASPGQTPTETDSWSCEC
jgi:hypothetical protein